LTDASINRTEETPARKYLIEASCTDQPLDVRVNEESS